MKSVDWRASMAEAGVSMATGAAAARAEKREVRMSVARMLVCVLDGEWDWDAGRWNAGQVYGC